MVGSDSQQYIHNCHNYSNYGKNQCLFNMTLASEIS